jgi:hypothetical protein
MPAPFDFSETNSAGIPMFRREVAHTPLNCSHCSSIVVRRLGFCGVAFLPCLLTYFFLEQVPQTCARLVQLRL